MRAPDTAPRIDERIYEGMRERVRYYGRNPAAIDRRLDELVAERYALRLLRGDFDEPGPGG